MKWFEKCARNVYFWLGISVILCYLWFFNDSKIGDVISWVIVLGLVILFGIAISKENKENDIIERQKWNNILKTSLIGTGASTYKTKSNTKTDTGSMIGRSIVGGAMFGTPGAIIGGSTAKQNTTSTITEIPSKERIFLVEYKDGTKKEDVAKIGTEKYKVYMSKLQ